MSTHRKTADAMPLSEPNGHIGIRLRAARKARGETVQDVATALKLQSAYIHALETLDKDALPGLGYGIGFVRAYAKHVGLDAQTAVARYKADTAAPQKTRRNVLPHHVFDRKIRLPRRAVAAFAVVTSGIGFASWYGLNAQAEPAPLSAALSAAPSIDSAAVISTNPDILTLQARTAGWVEVRDSAGEVVMSRIMLPGEIFEAPRDARMTVSARNASTVTVFQGGLPLGPLGLDGEIIEDQPLRGRIDAANVNGSSSN